MNKLAIVTLILSFIAIIFGIYKSQSKQTLIQRPATARTIELSFLLGIYLAIVAIFFGFFTDY